jgi:twitching motility protein PilJ
MGFAWKDTLGFASKDGGGAAVAAPDTEFGADLAKLASLPATAGAAAAEAAPHAHGAPEPTAAKAATRLRFDLGRLLGGSNPAADLAEDEAELHLPLIGHLSLSRQLRILLGVFAAGILVTLFALWRTSVGSANASAQTQIASDALMHSQRIGKAAPNAIQGNEEAFAQLEESRARLNLDLKVLTDGGHLMGREISAAPGGMERQLDGARKQWVASDNAAANLLGMKVELIGFKRTLKELDKLSPELLQMSEDLLNQKLQRGASARELAAAGRMMMLTQRMSKSAGEFWTSGGIRNETASELARDASSFRAAVEGFLNGNASLGLAATSDAALRARVTAIKDKFDVYHRHVGYILDNLAKFTSAKGAEQSIFFENEKVKNQLTQVQAGFHNEQDSKGLWFWLMVVASIFSLLTAGSISRVMLQDSRNRARGAELRRREAEAMRQLAQAKEEEAKATNDQNQAAILRLMNELQEVADGDLTVHATVSEDITGAIADSVNYTVEELRGLVERVTRTAEQVTTASTDAQAVSTELLQQAGQQSREIQDASSTVLKMAGEINEVSRSANESADVARQSVHAAQQGSTAVENAIKGMHEIREQIQETSKRIKRLGESSQEIGEITELISDITEQTNVLALNAAIQAASAGEAGRGFSVVAEEVQRLAERSAEAAKQIGALVRTIQTDTHDAVAAMEKSTQGVVEGAKLSDAAGAALADISRVSNRLAELIQGISFATELQATSANGVAHNMRHILEVTEHTQEGTRQTADSIRQLSALAQELKNSVSRFRIAA